MKHESVYDVGMKAKAKRAAAERDNKAAPNRPKLGRLKSALVNNENLAEAHALGQFFNEFIEGGGDAAERRARSADVSVFLDRSPLALRALDDVARVIKAAVWEEREIKVRELIGPLFNRTGRSGKDPIAAMAAQAGNHGPRSMGGKILKGAEGLRAIFGDIPGVSVGSIDYTKPKVDTSLNAKRDWMPVDSAHASETAINRLARISEVVGERPLVMMIRMAIFHEPLASVALALEEDEDALATNEPRSPTLKAAGVMVRSGFKHMADRGL